MSNRIPASVGYLAAGLVFSHAMLSVYWAAGGMAGLGLLSEGLQHEAEVRDTWFVALIWSVALAKVVAGCIVLALQRDWALLLPRWILRVVVLLIGVGLSFYALAQLGAGMAVLAGVVTGPDTDDPAFRAYLYLWAPFWLAIGVSYLLTAVRDRALEPHDQNAP